MQSELETPPEINAPLRQVIDARIDDEINMSSWDATTAGVLDAIRDALIANGLMAVS